MSRATVGLALGLLLTAGLTGCTVPLGPWGGPAYTLDASKIGSGEQVINPRNDSDYWNGQPMDSRTRR